MSKFVAGAKVKRTLRSYWPNKYGHEGKIYTLKERAGHQLEWLTHEGIKASEHYFEVVSLPETSPVRLETRKVIVPGVYGRVAVARSAEGTEVPVYLTNKTGNGKDGQFMNATELRAAAAVLIELAEALDQ